MSQVERLIASPHFACKRTPEGRTYVSQDVEPYKQFWLSERERRLLSAFSGPRGAEPASALTECGVACDDRSWAKTVEQMLAAGVLLKAGQDGSRYEHAIVEPYLHHRPFPPEIASAMIDLGEVGPNRQVLDLAGGPGDLALQFAARGAQVALMDTSGAFLSAARRRARQASLTLSTLHESCNRLIHEERGFDVVSIAQALHWLDDVQVLRGVLRVLNDGGHFFIVHSAIDVSPKHPLAHVLGHESILGPKLKESFQQEAQALKRRVDSLFMALQTRGVDRVEKADAAGHANAIASAGMRRYRQRRPFGMGFLRGLLTDRHLRSVGLDPAEFWADAAARINSVSPARLVGTHDWVLLHYRRSKRQTQTARSPMIRIGCSAPADDAPVYAQ